MACSPVGVQWTGLDWTGLDSSGLGIVPANLAWQKGHWNPVESSGVQWSPVESTWITWGRVKTSTWAYHNTLPMHFSGRACGGMFDLYVGYDERLLAETSQDLTTFQTPFGALRLVTLSMGWTNSVPIFHDNVTYSLKDEIPEVTIPYIDDVPFRGPATRYELPGGGYKTIPENSGIRKFVMEHFQNANRIVHRMKYAGGTFSGLFVQVKSL